MTTLRSGWILTAMLLILSAASHVLAEEPAWKQHHEAGLKALKAGRFDEAEERLKLAVVEAEKLGTDRPEVAEALHSLAGVDLAQQKTTEAGLLLSRALAILAKTPKADQGLLGRVYHNLAITKILEKKYDEAETLLKEALAIREKALGAEAPEVASTLGSMATILAIQNRSDEAESLMRRALAIEEKVYGTEGLELASTLKAIGSLRLKEGINALPNFDPLRDLSGKKARVDPRAEAGIHEAEALLTRALAIREKASGIDDLKNAGYLEVLFFCHSLHNDPRIVPMLKRLIAVKEKANGPDVGSFLCMLATQYTDQSNYREAIPLLKRAAALEKKRARNEQDESTAAELLRKAIRAAEVMDDPKRKPTDADVKSLKNLVYGSEERAIIAASFSESQFPSPCRCAKYTPRSDLAVWLGRDEIDLSNSNREFDDAGLAHLRGLANLERLMIQGKGITDKGLIHLEKLTGLTKLTLRGTKVAGPGLAYLKGMTELETLNLTFTPLDDAGLARLPSLATLKELDLSYTKVTDAGLVPLKRLTSLKNLDLSGTKVSEAGIKALKQARPGLEIRKDQSSSGGFPMLEPPSSLKPLPVPPPLPRRP